jgi:uncharacterized membrane protein
MALLIIGLILFLGAHLAPTFTDFHADLVRKLGEKPTKGVSGLISLAGFVMIVYGVSALRGSEANVVLWYPPLWGRHLAITLMLPAFILLATSHIPSHIRDVVRHPMLTATIVWALAHLVANGDLLALLLFGSFLAFALYDRVSVAQRGLGPKKPARGWGGDAAAVVTGTVLWAATLFWLHPLAGVPILLPHG